MEIRWLEAFVAVAEELHFGRAAARLRVAQSPLSQTIRKLEKDIGTPLFDRSTRSVELTAAGHGLLPHAYRILEEIDTATLASRTAAGSTYGKISIGFSGVLNHLSLPPLTRALRQQYPHIELSLVGRVLTREAVTKLTSGALDLSLVGLPVSASGLAWRLIGSEPYGAVLPVDHRLAGRTRVDLADLAQDPFVSAPLTQGSALQETILQACVNAGFRPHVVQETTDPYMIMLLVAAGVGVALMTTSMAALVPPGAVFVPLTDETHYMQHALAWSPERMTPALRTVLDVSEYVLPTPPGRIK